MEKMKLAILGAGAIAKTMARTVNALDDVELYAVASRDTVKAQTFADEFGAEKAYGSYESMLDDKSIDLVYVATPHSHHFEHVMLCLEAGKNVLCEKAFSINCAQAEQMIKLAKSKGLLLAEAIWVRYLPMAEIIRDTIAAGIIGSVTSLTANLGYPIAHIERITNPVLAGGALLDLGVYTLNFAAIAMGSEDAVISSDAVLSDKGVDMQNSITLKYSDGRMALLHSTVLCLTDLRCIVYGSRGRLEIDNINNYERIHIFGEDNKEIRVIERPEQITGYEYEVLSCKKAIENGLVECPEMPHSETLRIMSQMDEIRSIWGMKYPGE